jgi:predicted phosphodiesterase
MSIDINDVTIEKSLGSGMSGNVYLAKYNNKSYALKIEYVNDDAITPNLKRRLWREIYFAEKFSNNYPDYFVYLHAYDIINDCKEPQTKNQINNKIKYSSGNYDKYCSRKLYSFVDTTLDKIKLKNLNETYSMIIQLLNIANLLQNNMFVHADITPNNIGVNYTDKKTINLFGYDVPTYGKLYLLLDFGSVLHKDFIMDEYETKRYNAKLGNEADIIFFGHVLSELEYKNKKIAGEKYNFDKDYELFKKSNKYKKIKHVTHNKEHQIYLYDMFYHEKHVEDYYGKNIKINYSTFDIPKEDVLFYILSKRNIEQNIKYFYEKIINNVS